MTARRSAARCSKRQTCALRSVGLEKTRKEPTTMTEREFMIALLATVIVTLIVLTTIAAAAAERVDEAQTDSEPDEPPGATPTAGSLRRDVAIPVDAELVAVARDRRHLPDRRDRRPSDACSDVDTTVTRATDRARSHGRTRPCLLVLWSGHGTQLRRATDDGRAVTRPVGCRAPGHRAEPGGPRNPRPRPPSS